MLDIRLSRLPITEGSFICARRIRLKTSIGRDFVMDNEANNHGHVKNIRSVKFYRPTVLWWFY